MINFTPSEVHLIKILLVAELEKLLREPSTNLDNYSRKNTNLYIEMLDKICAGEKKPGHPG